MLPTSVISICVTTRPVLLTWISHGNIKRPAGQYTFPRTHSHTHTHTHTERERLYHGTVLTNNRKESTDGLMVRTMVYFQNHVWRFVSVYVRMCVIGTGNQNDPYINVCVCVCERDSVSIIEKPTEGVHICFKWAVIGSEPCWKLLEAVLLWLSAIVWMILGGSTGIFPSPCFVFSFRVQN